MNILLLHGCAGDPGRDAGNAVIEERQVIVPLENNQRPIPEPPSQPRVITTADSSESTGKLKVSRSAPASRDAVLSLLKRAENAIQKKRYQDAESLLTRALRIEPGNAWLWYNMAVVKFYQGDYRQAIQQATKSNKLAKNAAALTRNNWKIIEHSYRELGDHQNAEAARSHQNSRR